MDRAEYLHRKRVAHFNCLDDDWVESGEPPTALEETFASKSYQDMLKRTKETQRKNDEWLANTWREMIDR